MQTCGAKTRNGQSCKSKPMENGRCRMHGGASLKGAEHPNFKHGIYTQFTPQKIQSKVTSFLDADPFDLTHELALLRGLLSEFLSRFEFSNIDSGSILTMSSIVNDIRRLVDTIAKIKNDSALTAAEVTYLAVRATEIVHRYIDDPQKRQAFIEDLFAGVQGDDSESASQNRILLDGSVR